MWRREGSAEKSQGFVCGEPEAGRRPFAGGLVVSTEAGIRGQNRAVFGRSYWIFLCVNVLSEAVSVRLIIGKLMPC